MTARKIDVDAIRAQASRVTKFIAAAMTNLGEAKGIGPWAFLTNQGADFSREEGDG